MLDDRVRAVLERLEAEEPRPPGVAVEPTTGRFLFSVCAPQTDCEVLEIGAGHGYSTLWLAAAVRYLGGRVLSLEREPSCIADWRRKDRKSTRLNSSHSSISYAVFCLKKKTDLCLSPATGGRSEAMSAKPRAIGLSVRLAALYGLLIAATLLLVAGDTTAIPPSHLQPS